jgi:predicted enzyme related to lactoylglutathione lyase
MPGPARAGAMIYAMDPERLSSFYEQLLSMRRLHADADHCVIESDDFQLVIHAIQPPIAATITITTPPAPREDTAIKLFFTIDDLSHATALARALGGDVFEQSWQGPGFVARNGCDPEGNLFQLRQW